MAPTKNWFSTEGKFYRLNPGDLGQKWIGHFLWRWGAGRGMPIIELQQRSDLVKTWMYGPPASQGA